MTQLEKRAEQLARERQKIVIDRIATRLREQLNGVRIEVEQFEIRVRGVGLVKRWLKESGLRFVASMVK